MDSAEKTNLYEARTTKTEQSIAAIAIAGGFADAMLGGSMMENHPLVSSVMMGSGLALMIGASLRIEYVVRKS